MKLLPAQSLDFAHRLLNQPNSVWGASQPKRAGDGLRAAPLNGWFDICILPVADPAHPDFPAITGGHVSESICGIKIFSVIGPQLLCCWRLILKLHSVKRSNEVLCAGTAGRSSRIAIHDQDPFLFFRSLHGKFEQVRTFPLPGVVPRRPKRTAQLPVFQVW